VDLKERERIGGEGVRTKKQHNKQNEIKKEAKKACNSKMNIIRKNLLLGRRRNFFMNFGAVTYFVVVS